MCLDTSSFRWTSLYRVIHSFDSLHSATLAFQRTAKSVAYILNKEGIPVDAFINDFHGGETPDPADQSFDRMTQLFPELRLQSSLNRKTLLQRTKLLVWELVSIPYL